MGKRTGRMVGGLVMLGVGLGWCLPIRITEEGLATTTNPAGVRPDEQVRRLKLELPQQSPPKITAIQAADDRTL